MRQIRIVLLLTVMLCSFPGVVTGRSDVIGIEHDWLLTTGGGHYGLFQSWVSSPTNRTTGIFIGHRVFSTRLPAVYVVALMAAPLCLVSTFLLARRRRKTGTEPLR